MMRVFFQFLLAFLAITGAVLIASQFSVEFGNSNYWDHHGLLFLFFITVLPRLTLLLSSVATGGLLWWLGWLFAPRILVATLATIAYWQQNPVLVVIAWLVAVGGESSEKAVVVRRSSLKRRGYRPPSGAEVIDVTPIRKD
ncbi:MAG: hypothetical protein AB7N80_05965 [Bdellovibrionales bacterium]